MPQLAEKCRKIRPRSSIYQCALVAEEYPDDRVSMIYAGLMSLVSGARKSSKEDWKHVEEGIRIQPSAAASYEITVPARTLTSILEEVGPPKIDFFSLDVEGFELEVLKGLDLDRFRPEFILVEASYPEEIKPYLAEYEYGLIEQLTHHDLLYRDIQKNDPSGSWPDK
jgi:FkbM family methyltransferase